MNHAHFRFYAELNDFVPAGRRQQDLVCVFEPGQTVKHLVESFGVPHPEIEWLLVDGEPVNWVYQVQDGDRVSVYPHLRRLTLPADLQLRPLPELLLGFVLDGHLGRLAAYLRMLGFDALYRNDAGDAELAAVASRERRVLLTRDRGLLKRSQVVYGYWLRSLDPQRQVKEVLDRYTLWNEIAPFCRCINCNGLLQAVDKAEILDRLPPKTQRYYDDYRICQECSRLYWKGSHVHHMQALIDSWISEHHSEGVE